MEKIKEVSIPKESRIIVISDIHGEIHLFKKLLKKVDFTEKDYLIINGDMCEKGENSAEVVHLIMSLSTNNSRVHITEGNCDALVEELLDENPQIINYLLHRNSIMKEWLEAVGYILTETSTAQEVKAILLKQYRKEIDWLNQLPTAIETENFIFVHAGLEDISNWQDTPRKTAITIPSFLSKKHQANKYVVVGHWPVINYSTDIPSDNPIIDDKKKIIAIDGGNVVKQTGQLNALIIENKHFSYTYVDHFPTKIAVKDFQADNKMLGSINYPNYSIIPLEKMEYFTLCKQVETGFEYYVKNEYIISGKDGYCVKADVSCVQLNVTKGEKLSIVDDTCRGYTLIKKNGLLGWVPQETFR